ncbi:MAG TPA: ankyrin repeat domain-containing protein [Fimbriimonas sp.]
MVTKAAFAEALAFLDSGDLRSLETLLKSDPDLVRARSDALEPPYDAYFHGAKLLHHTAANPDRSGNLRTFVEAARLLLDYGADVDAATENGDWSWTTLGLAASSKPLVQANLDLAMIDLLLDNGSDPDWGNGIALYGALFHVSEEPRQLRPARYLALRGASLDLAYAAGVGSIDTVCRIIEPVPLPSDAYRMYRPKENRVEAPEDAFVLDEALVFASLAGQTECARYLIERGARVDSLVPLGIHRATALHWAAYVGWTDTVDLLLHRGASPAILDERYQANALQWARHAGRDLTAELLSSENPARF